MARINRSHHRIYIPRPFQISVAARNQPYLHYQSFDIRILWSDNIIHTTNNTQTKTFTHHNHHNERRNNDSQPNNPHKLRIPSIISTISTSEIHTKSHIFNNDPNHHIFDYNCRKNTQQTRTKYTNRTTTDYPTIIAQYLGEIMNTIIKPFDKLTTQELFNIYKLRVDVFVVEQQCPYHEVDDIDTISHHIYLQNNNSKILAYCRLYKIEDTFHIGRVIASERYKGYGTQIMKTALEFAGQTLHADSIIIEAQTYAQKFYEKLGFTQTSEPFDEDGISHIQMKYTVL